MYKLINDDIRGGGITSVLLIPDLYIPFDPANTDYQQFKKDVLDGAELQDADGNMMTPDEAMAFISNLP